MTDSIAARPAPAPYAGFDEMPIAGRWRRGRSERINRDLNPWTGETLLEISQASRDELDEAYASAAAAQRGWAAMLPGERAAVMRRAATVMEARQLHGPWAGGKGMVLRSHPQYGGDARAPPSPSSNVRERPDTNEREVLTYVRSRGERIPRMAYGIRGEANEKEM